MIRSKTLKWFFTFLMLFIFSSCSIFNPKVAPFVNTQKKGDIQIDANIMLSKENISSVSIEFASAYAITDKSYIQLNYSKYQVIAPKDLFQISGGYKFWKNHKIYLDASIGYNYQEIAYTKWYSLNIKSMSYKNYFGSFETPYSKIQLVYDNKQNTVLSIGFKSGIMYPSINDFNQKGLLIQPIFNYTLAKTESRYSFSFIMSYSDIFPIINNKINLRENYLFDKYGLTIGFCHTLRFNSKEIFQSIKLLKNKC